MTATQPIRRGWMAPILAALLISVAACAEQETYPVSGEECGPGDAVQELDATDCAPEFGSI